MDLQWRKYSEQLRKNSANVFDVCTSHFDQRFENMEKKNKINKHLAGLQHQDRQPRPATEAELKSDKESRKRTEGAAADGVKNGDTSFARVNDGPTSLTSVGNIAEPPAPKKCLGGALVNKGAEASKPHFPPVEVRMLSSAAGRLLHVGTASTTLRTIFPLLPPSWSLCKTEKIGKYSSATNCRLNFNQLAPPSLRNVKETKLMQTLVFDPGPSLSSVRGCPFLGGRRALLTGSSFGMLRWCLELEHVLLSGGLYCISQSPGSSEVTS